MFLEPLMEEFKLVVMENNEIKKLHAVDDNIFNIFDQSGIGSKAKIISTKSWLLC